MSDNVGSAIVIIGFFILLGWIAYIEQDKPYRHGPSIHATEKP